jgi:hypothetical protein
MQRSTHSPHSPRWRSCTRISTPPPILSAWHAPHLTGTCSAPSDDCSFPRSCDCFFSPPMRTVASSKTRSAAPLAPRSPRSPRCRDCACTCPPPSSACGAHVTLLALLPVHFPAPPFSPLPSSHSNLFRNTVSGTIGAEFSALTSLRQLCAHILIALVCEINPTLYPSFAWLSICQHSSAHQLCHLHLPSQGPPG